MQIQRFEIRFAFVIFNLLSAIAIAGKILPNHDDEEPRHDGRTPMDFAREKPDASKVTIIAHRGASGYLPEHTLEATAMAYAQGVDFIEQDVVLTKDDQAIVLHDIHLDTVSDVATVFPQRKRDDDRFYAIDFTLEEIRLLSIHERVDHKTGLPVFNKRFPPNLSSFKIPTLQESIEIIQGLNRSSGRNVGIYPEIKKPRWHRDQGKDISRLTLDVLLKYGYETKSDNAFLQCFDPKELRRIRKDLRSNLKLVQLIGSNEWSEASVDYHALVTAKGLHDIAQYADGIGPWMPYIVTDESVPGQIYTTDLVKMAHQNQLVVHPFTFRADALPTYANSFSKLIAIFVNSGVDGMFTDHAGETIRAVGR